MFDIVRNAEFEAHKERCKKMVPVGLTVSGLPLMLRAGNSIDKLAVSLKNGSDGVVTTFSENAIKVFLEILQVKVLIYEIYSSI